MFFVYLVALFFDLIWLNGLVTGTLPAYALPGALLAQALLLAVWNARWHPPAHVFWRVASGLCFAYAVHPLCVPMFLLHPLWWVQIAIGIVCIGPGVLFRDLASVGRGCS